MTLTLTLTLTQVGENRTYTQCGTEEYVPPEMLKGRGRTRASDWWA